MIWHVWAGCAACFGHVGCMSLSVVRRFCECVRLVLHAGVFVCGLLGCVFGMCVVMLVAWLVCVWCVVMY